MSIETVDATFYVQIEPEWASRKLPSGEQDIYRAKAVRVTQSRPEKPARNTVSIKLTVRLPKAAFHPLRPEAVIEIPAELVQTNEVAAVAEMPEEQS